MANGGQCFCVPPNAVATIGLRNYRSVAIAAGRPHHIIRAGKRPIELGKDLPDGWPIGQGLWASCPLAARIQGISDNESDRVMRRVLRSKA